MKLRDTVHGADSASLQLRPFFKRLLSAANTIRANETRSHCGRDEQSRPPKKFGDIRSDTKSRLINSKSKSGTLGAPPYVLTFSAGGVACPKLYSGVWQW